MGGLFYNCALCAVGEKTGQTLGPPTFKMVPPSLAPGPSGCRLGAPGYPSR